MIFLLLSLINIIKNIIKIQIAFTVSNWYHNFTVAFLLMISRRWLGWILVPAASATLFIVANERKKIRRLNAYHYLSDDIATPLIRRFFDGEQAHNIAIRALQFGLGPADDDDDRDQDAGVDLSVFVPLHSANKRGGGSDTKDGVYFRNCIGLAAGDPNLSQFNPNLSQFNPELSQFNPKL